MKKIKWIMLIITFALSHDYFWKGMYAITSLIAGQETSIFANEITIRSICLCFHIEFAVFFTDDGHRFEAFLERNALPKAIVDGMLRTGATVTYALAYFSRIILVADEKNKTIIEDERKKALKQTFEEYYNMLSAPLLLRFMVASTPLIIAISIIQLYSRDLASSILSISSYIVGGVGLLCNCINCTDEPLI